MTDFFGDDDAEPDDSDMIMQRSHRGDSAGTGGPNGEWSTRIRFADGTDRLITNAALIGRDPDPAGGIDVIKVDDDSRSVSKNHVAIDFVGGTLLIRDLDTVNGTTIERDRELMDIGADGVPLQVGDVVTLGEVVSFTVESIEADSDDRTILRPSKRARGAGSEPQTTSGSSEPSPGGPQSPEAAGGEPEPTESPATEPDAPVTTGHEPEPPHAPTSTNREPQPTDAASWEPEPTQTGNWGPEQTHSTEWEPDTTQPPGWQAGSPAPIAERPGVPDGAPEQPTPPQQTNESNAGGQRIIPVPPGFDGESPPATSVRASQPPPTVAPAAGCVACGDHLEPHAAFCVNCGTPVAAPPPPPEIPPTGAGLSGAHRPAPARRIGPRPVIIGLGGVIVLVIIAVVLSRCGGEDGFASYNGVTMADSMEPSFDLDASAATGEFGKLNAIIDDQLVQFDKNGDERWATDLPNGGEEAIMLDPIDGLVPVYFPVEDSSDHSLVFFDSDSGKPTDTEIEFDWSSTSPTVFLGHLYLMDDDGERIELYDPRSGDRVAKVNGSLTIDAESRVVFDFDSERREVSVYDLDLKPIVSDVEFDRGAAITGFHDGKVITVNDDEIRAYDSDGEAWVSRTDIDDLTRAEPLADGRWFIFSGTSGDAAVVANVGDEEVDEKWSDTRISWVQIARDDRLLLADDGEFTLIDLDGEEIFNERAEMPVVLANGVILEDSKGDEYELTGFDLDGNEKWQIETVSPLEYMSIVSNALFDPSDGTVYGPK